MTKLFTNAAVLVTTALTPLALVLAICVGQAAHASGDYNYDQRGSWNYKQGADNTHCSIGYGCK